MNEGKSYFTNDDVLEVLRKLLAEKKEIASPLARNDSTIFTGGAVGYISYDYGMTLENIFSRHARANSFPEIFFGLYDSALCFNHRTKEWSLNSIENYELGIRNYELRVTNLFPHYILDMFDC